MAEEKAEGGNGWNPSGRYSACGAIPRLTFKILKKPPRDRN
jgi:hypothetical protein